MILHINLSVKPVPLATNHATVTAIDTGQKGRKRMSL